MIADQTMRFLLISSTLPVPPVSGDRQRTHLIMDALLGLGSVDLMVVKPRSKLDEEYVVTGRDSFTLRAFVDTTAAKGRLNRIRRQLREALLPLAAYQLHPGAHATLRALVAEHQYDAIIVRYLHTVSITGANLLGLPCHVDLDDYEPGRYRTRGEIMSYLNPRKVLLWRDARLLVHRIQKTVPRLGAIWVADAQTRREPGLQGTIHLPNIPFPHARGVAAERVTTESESITGATPGLLVVTSRNRGNLDGIRKFAECCMPTLRANHPGLRLRVAGNNIPPEDTTFLQRIDGVDVLGKVEDLIAEYARCSATIAPVLHGAGTSIKVLESFLHGKPCVINSFAARGLEDLPARLRSQIEVLDVEAMEGVLAALLSNPEQSKVLGQELKQWVRTARSQAAFNDIVRTAILSRIGPQSTS